jgi:hypothetical protein
MQDFNDPEMRLIGFFYADIWEKERRWLQRHPMPWELAVRAYIEAHGYLRRATGNRFQLPRLARNVRLVRLVDEVDAADPHRDRTLQMPSAVAWGDALLTVSDEIERQAELALVYLADALINPLSPPDSAEMDRRVFKLVVQMVRDKVRVNDTKIGSKVGLSHTTARDRKIDMGERLIKLLARDCPSIWKDGTPRAARLWREAV